MLLLVNTLQKDLQSSNVVEVCTALTTIAKIMNAEMVPAVLPMVEEKCSHSREIVRKKAVLALHRFHTKSPSSVGHLTELIRRALCDSDPGVMAASLNILYDMARCDCMKLKDLTPSFVAILKQVIDRRLPRDFDYHRVPAPWMQIKLLKIMSLLGANDQSASEAMYEVVRTCLAKAESQGPAAYFVVYEALRTITLIYPSQELVGAAAASIGRFLRAENNNLKYLGITSLVAVVQVNPAYAAEHQMVVIECLDDPDETLKRKTLELLCKMTNPANVEVIVDRLMAYLKSSVDPYLRKDLVPRIVGLAERFAPDNQWFLETAITLFEHAGDLVPAETFHSVLSLISNPESGDDAEDNELRIFAFESFMELLEKPKVPDCLLQAMCWVVGEYAYLATDYDQAKVLELVASALDRTFERPLETRTWIFSAITKLVAQNGSCPPGIRTKLDRWRGCDDADVSDRHSQLLVLAENPALMQQVLPLDASADDLGVDENLGFLNGVVQQALAAGAQRYLTAEERRPVAPVPEDTSAAAGAEAGGLRFDAYEAPPPAAASSLFAGLSQGKVETAPAPAVVSQGEEVQEAAAPVALSPEKPSLIVKQRRWGKGGDVARKAAAAPAASAAAAAVPEESSTPEAVSGDLLGGGEAAVPGSSVPAAAAAAPAPAPAPVPAAVAPPELSAEEQKKKELASQLFGGGDVGAGRRARTSRAKKQPAAAATGDLLGGSAAEPPATNSGGVADLLSGVAAAPAAPSAPAGGTADLLGGLFGDTGPADLPPPTYSAEPGARDGPPGEPPG